jgi:septal ring factor EnvC (AmiA/AmiB activator)
MSSASSNLETRIAVLEQSTTEKLADLVAEIVSLRTQLNAMAAENKRIVAQTAEIQHNLTILTNYVNRMGR